MTSNVSGLTLKEAIAQPSNVPKVFYGEVNKTDNQSDGDLLTEAQMILKAITSNEVTLSPSTETSSTDNNLKEKHFCPICKKEATQLCSRCKKVYYCSIECQKNDWINHKINCKQTRYVMLKLG